MLTQHKRLRILTNLSQLLRLSVHTILIALLLISSLPSSRSDSLYHSMHDDHDYHLDSSNENRVQTEAQCKHYLCKYGYLKCNCTSYLALQHERHKRAFTPPIPTELEHHNPYQPDYPVTFPPELTTPSSQACHRTHFIRAYEEFQTIYRLNVTRHCDRVTKSFMSRSRCGQPDIFDKNELDDDDRKHGGGLKRTKVSSFSSQEHDYSSEEDNYWKRKKRSADTLEELVDAKSPIRTQQLEELIAKEEADNQDTYNNGQSTRKKRSFHFQISDPIGKLNKDIITWRLMRAHTNPSIPVTRQNAILTQAFRYWSEVAPICFRQDKLAPRVDIEIGFLEGTHLNCYKQFDGRGGEVAHKFFRDIHFDKTDPYTAVINPPRPTDISLLLVAVHEIGHVLGLNHSAVRDSVMNAIYHRNIRGRFELSNHDRLEIKSVYGACSGRFDVVMDYVRNSATSRVFNTYFFRGGNFWMYENKNGRTRYGDPKKISSPNWNGLPANLDAYVHYFESDRSSRSRITDHYYFFKGSTYYQYDSNLDRVTRTGLIRSLFPRGPHGVVPSNLDAAFFEHNTRKIFFFKGDSIYKYNYRLTGTHSCCIQRPSKIVDVFRPATPADLYATNTRISYATNLDAVYLSWTAPYTLYLFKGEHAWKVDGYAIRGPYSEANLRVRYVGKWNTIWNYVCETDCPS